MTMSLMRCFGVAVLVLAVATASPTTSKVVWVTSVSHYQALLQSPRLVVVDMWAAWCGPCRMMDPRVEELAAELSDSVDFVKVEDKDELADIFSQLGVSAFPTFVIFKNGKEVDRKVGTMSKAALKALIEQNY